MAAVLMPSGSHITGSLEIVRRFLVQGGRVVDPAPRSPAKVSADRKVRVLAVVHGWFPFLAAGSERMMQHLLSALPEDEFEVQVLSYGAGEPDSTMETDYEYEGTPVHRGLNPPRNYTPDLIILHHGYAARLAPTYTEQFPHASVVVVYHNERYDIPDLKAVGADLNVFNTKWVKDALRLPGIVVRPPLEYERHHVDQTGDRVTLINLQENKGVDTFYSLGQRMGEFQFLGVIGTHGDQKFPPPFRNHQIEVMGTTQDMREVWAQTKVLLMPSEYESYGMCAAEACVSGIPVIAHPTPGLTECLGSAGIFIDREDVDGYEKALRLLLTDENHYQERSALAALRGRELVSQTQKELRKFVTAIRKLVR